ncbi:MAG TPA: RluA family pseudouridine synthase [Verrucomicrobiota bacterium]|nr:RluA family pseudouridine synthase [Verrucomicrobiota bacterium]
MSVKTNDVEVPAAKTSDLFTVIHEDADLLVVNKPAGLVCHPTKGDVYSSLISRVRLHLGDGARPHLVNRLDRETSGVTVVAKNPVAAGELGRVWESRAVRKEYLAIVHGHVRDDSGLIDAPLGKDESSRVAIKDCVRPDGSSAQTEFQVIRRFTRDFSTLNSQPSVPHHSASSLQPLALSLVHVTPRTGRKHQIRIHLAHLGHPIVGDKLYGGDEDLYLALVEGRLTDEQRRRLLLPYHALHAEKVVFPWKGREAEFCADPEEWFTTFGAGELPQ